MKSYDTVRIVSSFDVHILFLISIDTCGFLQKFLNVVGTCLDKYEYIVSIENNNIVMNILYAVDVLLNISIGVIVRISSFILLSILLSLVYWFGIRKTIYSCRTDNVSLLNIFQFLITNNYH